MKWLLCFLVGVIVSLVGFCNNLAVENLAGVKFVVTSNMMLEKRYQVLNFAHLFSFSICFFVSFNGFAEFWKLGICRRFQLAFFIFFVSNLSLTLFASLITALIAPAATGSGIPEVKAYLNGVDAPGIFTVRTLFVKVYNKLTRCLFSVGFCLYNNVILAIMIIIFHMILMFFDPCLHMKLKYGGTVTTHSLKHYFLLKLMLVSCNYYHS